MRAIISFIVMSFCVQTALADLRDFRKRKKKLKDLKVKCEKMHEPKRTDCLEKYQKKAAKYKNDLAAYKSDVSKEEAVRANRPPSDIGKDIETRKKNIKDFADVINTSCQSKTPRCGHALYQLGNLTYRNEEDEFRIKQEKYEKDMQRWEDRDKSGPEPSSPHRNHVESLKYFQRLLNEYPKYVDMPKVYYRLAFIHSIQGEDDKSYEYLTMLVTKHPDHGLTIPAYLRIGEHWFLQRKYQKAIENYEKIPPDLKGSEAALALYHKAECYYNMADFEKAARVYYDYVMRADRREFKADLRDEALEFMAASWADMDNGVDIAHKFLAGKGHPWENDVYYQMGQKNHSHDRLEEARKAFRFLLDIDPNYPKAPIADMTIVSSLIIEKRNDEAQNARLALVERYKPGSAWETANSGDKKNMEEAQKAVKKAMFQIPVYNHLKGSKDKNKPDVDMLGQAEQYYLRYLERYTEKNWETYEVHQNLGSVYSLLKQYEKAAGEYKWCMEAPTDAYGKMPPDKKKVILTRADAAYNRVYTLDLNREKAVKSVGDNKVQAYQMPETKAYFKAVEEYMAQYGGGTSAPDIAYNAALVHYEAKNYTDAITSLQSLLEKFPSHKHSNLIRRMLGQSLLEDQKFVEAEKVFTELLQRTSKGAKQYNDIVLSIASTIFKQADVKAKEGAHKEAAMLYLKVVQSYGKVKIADKALFEAGLQFEKAEDVPNATHAFLRIHKEYTKSELKIKAIMKAASIFRKAEQYKEAAQTFLVIRDKFPKDSSAFGSIGWAADAYAKVPDTMMAARVFESAHKRFPKNLKTPSFLYNAGQLYEDAKNYAAAIRVYQILGDDYAKSNFALEAMFSIPLIQEKQGDHGAAAAAYKNFINKYQKDPQKLVRAQLAAGKIYDLKLGKRDDALKYYNAVNKTFTEHKDIGIPGAIAAEAAFRGGEIFYDRVKVVKLNASKKENAKRLKKMTSVLQTSVEHYTVAMEMEEKEWTLRSTMRIGDLFMRMADITGNEKLHSRNKTQQIGEKINMLRGLPKLYSKSRSMYQKNLDLAREQGLKSSYVDSSQVRYMETYWLEGMVFENIGKLLSDAPIPKDLTEEEVIEYKEILKDKTYEAQQAAKPIYATSLKAAQFYSIENESKRKISERLREIDPEAPELDLKHRAPDEQVVRFIDNDYKNNMKEINRIYEDASMSDSKKIAQLKKLEAAAKKEIDRLTAELNSLQSQGGEGLE